MTGSLWLMMLGSLYEAESVGYPFCKITLQKVMHKNWRTPVTQVDCTTIRNISKKSITCLQRKRIKIDTHSRSGRHKKSILPDQEDINSLRGCILKYHEFTVIIL